MAWDRERYRREVLGPARRSGPPADLFVRYGFTGQLPAGAAFRTQIDEVVGLWKTLKSKPGWGKLIEGLLTQHAALGEQELTPAAFQALRGKEQAEAARRLDKLVKGETATHVGPAVVARLRDAAGAGVDDAQVRRALAAVSIKVIDRLPELPVSPPPKYEDLSPALRTLGLKLSAEVIFGPQAVQAGFRVLGGFVLTDGRRLNEPAWTATARRSSEMAHADSRKTPTETVLTVIKSASRDGTLDKLLLWEVMGLIRQQAADGFGQKVIADEAAESGLDRDEAGILAAAMLAEGADAGLRRLIEEDLTAGRLRSAALQAGRLPGGDELRTRVDARTAEVAGLVAGADAELSAGRPESAARLLADAARVTDDPDLAERLAGLAPPPPGTPRAVVDGDRVLVSWQASATQAGQVRYRVTRGVGRAPGSPAEGVVIAAETGELHAADQSAPPGADLRYAVFAGRGGPQWSPPACSAKVVFAPEVTEVKLSVGADAVSAVWRTPQGASEVRTVRVAAGCERRIESDLTGFTDTGLTAGTEYLYRITVVYRADDGSARATPGVAVRAAPALAPVPVGALYIQARPSAVEVSWAPPPFGRVDLLVGQSRPPWSPGAEPGQAELAAFGHPVPGTPRPAAPGRVSVELAPPQGRRYLLAVTRVGPRAVAGAWAELGVAEPVSGLGAQRLLDEAQLSWIWPAGAVDSIIAWPGGERRCSRRVYDDEGGVTIPVGPDEMVVTVSAVHPDQTADLVAFAVPVTIQARKAKVQYRWLKAGALQPGRRLLELTTDRACELPELVVVRSTAAFPPDEPGDGVEVTRLPPASITPGTPLKVPVDLPRRATGFLACFTTASCDPGPLLFPPPPSEMRIR